MTASARYSLSDYQQLYERIGFDYRSQDIDGECKPRGDITMAEGTIEEQLLPGGITMMISDVVNERQYGAEASIAPGFTSIVMLDGHADAVLSGRTHLRLRSRGAFSATHGEEVGMRGEHPAGVRLRSVALMVRYGALDLSRVAEPLAELAESRDFDLRHWRPSAGLLMNLEMMFGDAMQGGLGKLWREAVGHQLLAEALGGLRQDDERGRPTRLSGRDRMLIERVRDLMLEQPEDEHTLQSLANVACMSVSSLQQKFHLAFDQTVIDYLRDQRMQRAHEGLMRDGWTVQQAAERCGFRYASNFATAFRRRYGVAPRALKGR